MNGPYRTVPEPSSSLPRGVPYIVGNETAERFSFYGMKAILIVFMTEHLLAADGTLDVMSKTEATRHVHEFVFWAYFFGVVGALVSDGLLGKYRTIIVGSLIYCVGHLAMTVVEPIPGFSLGSPRSWLQVGLLLIAVGAGGIKPCVSAHVGDQFGRQNVYLLSRVFSWFYFSINLGAFASMLVTPLLLRHYGPSTAFALPAVLMLLATIVFWMGRYRFVHVPPGGLGSVQEALSGSGLRALLNLSVIFLFVAVFWTLFDQTASTWVLQAKSMDRTVWGVELLPSQIQAANPVFILLLIPIFSYVIYPTVQRVVPLTPLRKISIGLFVAAGAFAISAWIESQIMAGSRPHILWQIVAYVVITSAEIMVAITCLEFSYTQAPPRMKSLVMALFMMSVALGNLFTAKVNQYIEHAGETPWLSGANYYWFFTAVMFATALAFTAVARLYRGQTYIQGDRECSEP